MFAESGAHNEAHGLWECAGVTHVVVVVMTDDCRLDLFQVNATSLQDVSEAVVNPDSRNPLIDGLGDRFREIPKVLPAAQVE